jgi:hypothetical protein
MEIKPVSPTIAKPVNRVGEGKMVTVKNDGSFPSRRFPCGRVWGTRNRCSMGKEAICTDHHPLLPHHMVALIDDRSMGCHRSITGLSVRWRWAKFDPDAREYLYILGGHVWKLEPRSYCRFIQLTIDSYCSCACNLGLDCLPVSPDIMTNITNIEFI